MDALPQPDLVRQQIIQEAKLSRIARMMSLVKPETLNEFTRVILSAALTYEYGGDWRSVIRRARNRHRIGAIRKLYDEVYNYDGEQIEQFASAITREESV